MMGTMPMRQSARFNLRPCRGPPVRVSRLVARRIGGRRVVRLLAVEAVSSRSDANSPYDPVVSDLWKVASVLKVRKSAELSLVEVGVSKPDAEDRSSSRSLGSAAELPGAVVLNCILASF